MSIQVGIGFSQNPNAAKAAQEAAEEAYLKLKEARIDLAIIFSTVDYAPTEILPIAHRILDKTKVVGCSTAGIILPDKIAESGVGIIAINSDYTRFETGFIPSLELQDLHQVGLTLAKNSITDFSEEHRKFFFCFFHGQLKNMAGMITGIKDHLGASFPVYGAGSMDNFQRKRSFQYTSSTVLEGSVCGFLAGGHINCTVHCRHGWRPLGKPRFITKSFENIILSIDGEKADTLYKNFFPEAAADPNSDIFNRYPLGIYDDNAHEYIIRHVTQIREDGSLICQDHVPAAARVHLMIGSKDSCLESTRETALKIKEQLQGRKPKILLVFESCHRYKMLGNSNWQEIRLLKNILGENVPIFGMLSDGEISSWDNGQSYLQNQSSLIIAFA